MQLIYLLDKVTALAAPVSDAPSGDADPFQAAMIRLAARRLGGALHGLRRLTGGASQELWSFDVAPPNGSPREYVLRRESNGDLARRMETAGLEAEAAVIGVVAASGAPVPDVAYVLTPEDGLGRGFVMTRIPGEALGGRIVREARFAAVRPRLAAQCGRVLAAIHGTPTPSLPPLSRRGPSASVDKLVRQLDAFGEPRPVFELALVWLRHHLPPANAERLVHGDFRTGNFLLEPEGISAVLDWEGCHLGDPMEDLGWLCMPVWRFGRLDLPVGGFGLRADLFAAYEAASDEAVDPARVRFWEIYGMVRWGLTCMAMAEAFLDGERSIERAAVGRRASEAEIEILHALTSDEAT